MRQDKSRQNYQMKPLTESGNARKKEIIITRWNQTSEEKALYCFEVGGNSRATRSAATFSFFGPNLRVSPPPSVA